MILVSSSVIARFHAVERVITNLSVGAACGLLAAAALTGLFQVLSRFVLHQPATWSETLVRTLLIWMVYLGLPGAMRMGALVSVDFLYRKCGGQGRRVLRAVVSVATLFLLTLLVWFGWMIVYRVRFQNLAGLEIPASWAYAAIPTGSLLSWIAVVARYFDYRQDELTTAS